MKAVCYLRPGMAVLDMPEPQIKHPTDIKIKIAYASICGSDPHILAGHFDYAYPEGRGPYIIGHESSGTIVEMGSGCRNKNLKVGDKVTFYFKKYCGKCYYCRNGKRHLCDDARNLMHSMADYVVVDEQQVYRIPDHIPLRRACLAEPISVCVHATDLADLRAGESLCIFGGGAIGLLTLQLARLSGCYPIVLCEPVKSKRELALQLGADYALNPNAEDFMEQVRQITAGRGFERVMECAGFWGAAQPAFECLGKGGTLVYASTQNAEFNMPFNLNQLWAKEGVVKGVYQSGYAMERAVALLNRLKLDELITAELPAEEAEQAFAAHRSGENPKVILRFAGEKEDVGVEV